MEYCHFSWEECWNLPREYRRWFIERKQQENKRIEEARKKQKRNAPASPKR